MGTKERFMGLVQASGLRGITVAVMSTAVWLSCALHGRAAAQGTSPLVASGWSVTSEGNTYNVVGSDGAGDVNGDGYADLLVGSDVAGRGAVSLYLGGGSGPGNTAARTMVGEQ